MMDFFRKHMKVIFLITIVGFLAGAFIGFGGYFFGARGPADAVAEINGVKVPYRHYTSLLNRALENLRQNKTDTSDESMIRLKQEVLQEIIQEEVFWQEAKKYGITVSDQELAAAIQNYPAFQNNKAFDRNAYFQVVYQRLRTTPREFEESQRRQIAISKLRQLIASNVKISEPELRLEYARAHGGNMAAFDQDREKFLESFQKDKTMMTFNEWFKQLNQTMKIKVFLDEIEGAQKQQ
jgi:peptidyl-prolyl cis-trans isomerase D